MRFFAYGGPRYTKGSGAPYTTRDTGGLGGPPSTLGSTLTTPQGAGDVVPPCIRSAVSVDKTWGSVRDRLRNASASPSTASGRTSDAPMYCRLTLPLRGRGGPLSACMRRKYSSGTSMRPRITYVLIFPSSSAQMYVSRVTSSWVGTALTLESGPGGGPKGDDADGLGGSCTETRVTHFGMYRKSFTASSCLDR